MSSSAAVDADHPPKNPQSIYDFVIWDIFHKEQIPLSRFRGQVVVIVNVATKCGFTSSNYSQLSALQKKYYDKGLRVLLFPCNQFGNQEPGTADTICHFIQGYAKEFVIAEKCDVNGAKEHPLYTYLKKKQGGFIFNAIKWNFTKFLVDKNGQPVARFSPNDEPNSFESKIVNLLNAQGTSK